MDTVEQRIAQLEQRLEQMGSALDRAEREARALRRGSGQAGRGARLARLAAACGAAATIGALTMGTAAAKPGPQPLTVKAPFTVVTGSGKKVVQVNTLGQLIVYHANYPAVVLGPGENAAGLVQVLTPGGDPVAELASLADGTGQLAVVGDQGRVARLSTPSDSNQLTLRFYNGKTELAGVGADKAGLVQINDATGKKMVLLGSNNTSGTVGTFDTSGAAKVLLATTPEGQAILELYAGAQPVVVLKQSTRGDGYFGLANNNGNARVEVGVLPSDKGVVRAFGPKGFDYISGR